MNDLINYLEKKANDISAVGYLMSGLATSKSYNGLITAEMFKENFYVAKSAAEESYCTSLINDLFAEPNHNVMALRAHGGSGKTVFINMLSTRNEAKDNLEYINIDFEKSISYTGFELVINKILQSTRKWLKPMFDAQETQEYQTRFRQCADKVLQILSNMDAENELFAFWKKVNEIIFTPENIDVNTRIQKVMRSLSFEQVKNFAGESKIIGVQISCLLLVLLILSKPNDKNKYIIVFDNIEAISNNLAVLPDVVTKTWKLLHNIFTAELFEFDFFKKITFLLAVRTTTNLSLVASQEDTFWGASNKYIYDLNYDDFCAEALLKKLKFLYDVDSLRYTNLYKDTYLICSLVCTESIINKYLHNEKIETIDYKLFTRIRLSPFFGNNFRQVISHLGLVLGEQKKKRISYLLNETDGRMLDIRINGARNILFNSIFNSFTTLREFNQSIFSFFGIGNIAGEQNHSMTRIILSFLYWDKVRFCLQNKGLEYSGVSLKRVIDSFRYHYSDDMEVFVGILHRLSQLPEDDRRKTELMSQWSYLIKIDTVTNLTIDELWDIVNNYLTNNQNVNTLKIIKLELSEAGSCFISSFSNHFEFFNSRVEGNNLDPLFMHDNELEVDEYYFENLIKFNLVSISNFVEGMIKNGKEACSKFQLAKISSLCYKENCDHKSCFDILNCSLFIRYIEMSSTVIEAINYIDRYRQYLWHQCKDVAADNKLLDYIKQYGDLMAHIRGADPMFDIFCKNPYKELFNKENKEYNEIFQKNGLVRIPHNAYYYEKNSFDCIFEAIEYEKINHTGLDLYTRCEAIASIK